MKYVQNGQYIKVKVCCKSCANKVILANGDRICVARDNKVIQRTRACKNWHMDSSIAKAGIVRKGAVIRDMKARIAEILSSLPDEKTAKIVNARERKRKSRAKLRAMKKSLRVVQDFNSALSTQHSALII